MLGYTNASKTKHGYATLRSPGMATMKPAWKYSAANLSPHTIAPRGVNDTHSVTLGARLQAAAEHHNRVA